MTRRLRIGLLLGALLLASHAGAEQAQAPPALQSFEFLGCSGEYEGTDSKPRVWRLVANGEQVNYLTRTVGGCGKSARNPVVTATGDGLDLAFELHSPDGKVIFCECYYWAAFSFGPEALTIGKVSVNDRETRQMGDWPER